MHRSVLASQKTSVRDMNNSNMPSFVPLPSMQMNSKSKFDIIFPSHAERLTQKTNKNKNKKINKPLQNTETKTIKKK